MESNLEMRRSEAAKIEGLIAEESDSFQHWVKTLGVQPVIRALQEKSNAIHEETLDSLFNKLPELDEHQRKIIRRLTKSIVNQMMHDPINVIKEMSGDKNGNESLEFLRRSLRLRIGWSLIGGRERRCREEPQTARTFVRQRKRRSAQDCFCSGWPLMGG